MTRPIQLLLFGDRRPQKGQIYLLVATGMKDEMDPCCVVVVVVVVFQGIQLQRAKVEQWVGPGTTSEGRLANIGKPQSQTVKTTI